MDQKNNAIAYFQQIVEIGPKTEEYLHNINVNFEADKDLFPLVYDYFKDKKNEYVVDQTIAWLYAMILAELVPAKRDDIYKLAYNYCEEGKKQPVFGWEFESDPNIGRIYAGYIYATTRDADKIPELREELGGDMLTYKEDMYECLVNTTFFPHAPGPYLSDNREYPVGDANADHNLVEDQQIHDYICKYYNLDTKDAEKRQATIQAIADKEGEMAHLFGKPRTVKDDKYGEMTFNPVFGKHNIGVEIPDDGAIAKLIDLVTSPCSNARKTLLKQEYGRRRPGQGFYDGTRNNDPAQRALVNYAIEEGDGVTTGYYNKDGDYIDNNGTHIGDYEKYFQSYLYANSYPSGHSALIMGAALVLIEVMPDKAEEIFKAANQYSINRNIARYHWTSDTIYGRMIGTAQVPVLHAVTNLELDKLIEKAKKEYKKISK